MAKISNTTSYPNATPAANDYVIGTDIDDNNATKTFKLQEIANLYAGSGSGTVTSVGLDGGTTGLTITSDTTNPITTTGTFTLGGTLAVANGGTGLTSLTEGSILIGDSSSSISALAIGANTYVLTSDGTTASWQAPTSGGGISFNGNTASGIVSRGGATTADVSADIIVAGSQILFDGSAGNTGVKYDLGTNKFQIGAIGGGVDTVDIYSAGVNSLTISSTVSQFKNSSHTLFDNGIKLGSTGETLDAYEEGTWTPVMFGAGSPTVTTTGEYVKIGRKVTVWFSLICSAGDTLAVARISGLPFNGQGPSVYGHNGGASISVNTGNSANVRYVTGASGGATTLDLKVFTTSSITLNGPLPETENIDYQYSIGYWPNSQGSFTVRGTYTYKSQS